MAAAHAAMPSDFDGDGYADLAIGAPGEAVRGTKPNAGVVHVIRGSASGLTEDGDQLWSQDLPGVKGVSLGGLKSGDRFGATLASGDFDRDGHADLAIGVYRDRLVPRRAQGRLGQRPVRVASRPDRRGRPAVVAELPARNAAARR